MRKRKVALFMAAIMTLTSVYPGGIVLAEDIIVEETAIEAPAAESSEENSRTAEVSVEDSLVVEEVPAADAAEITGSTNVQAEGPAEAVSEETAAALEVPVWEPSNPVEVPEETVDEAPTEELTDPAEVPEEAAGEMLTEEPTDPAEVPEEAAEELPDSVEAPAAPSGELFAPVEVSEETTGEAPTEEPTDPVEVPAETAGEALTEEPTDPIEVPAETTGETLTEGLSDSVEITGETAGEAPTEEQFDLAVMPEELPNDTETAESEKFFEEVTDGEETMPNADILEGDTTPAELIGEDGDFIVDVAAVNEIEPMSEIGIAEIGTDSGEYASELNLDEAEEIVSGKSYKVTLSEGESKLLKFTPTEEGRYYIYSEGDADTYVMLYGADKGELGHDDDSIGTNFCLYYNLESSVTYYYEVYGYNHSAAEFDVILSRTKEVASAQINAADSYEPYAMKSEIYDAQVEITYKDGTMSEKIAWGSDTYYDEASSESGSALFYETRNEESVYLTLYAEDGRLVGMPENRLPRSGSYTLKAIINGQVCASKEISIVEPKIEKALTLGEEPYELDADMHKWYSFTPNVAGQYVIKNNGGSIWVYETEAGYLEYLYFGNTLYDLEGGKEYLIVVSADSESPVSGSIAIESRKALSSVKLNADAFYDAGTFKDRVENILVKVGYNETVETETVDSWGVGFKRFGDDEKEYSVASTYTENGDELYLSLWSGDQVIDVPFYEEDKIPVGDFTLKVSASENPDISDTAEIHIGGPETAVSLEEGVKTDYNQEANGCVWYKFTAEEAGQYFVENHRMIGSAYVSEQTSIYTLENGYLNLSETIYDSLFDMEAGKEYFFATTEYYGDSAKGTFCVKKKKEVVSVELETAADGFYDAHEADSDILKLPVKLIYDAETGERELIKQWMRDGLYDYDGSSYHAFYRETSSKNTVYLTFWQDGQITDMPLPHYDYESGKYEDAILTGKYTLKLVIDGEIYESKTWNIEIGIHNPTDLNLNGSSTYNLDEDGHAWYTFTTDSSDTNEYNIQLARENGNGYASFDLYTYKGNRLQPVTSDGNTSYVLKAEPDTTYMIVVYEDGGGSPNGSIKVYEKKAIASAEIVAENTYNLKTAQKALRNVQATISYVGSKPLEETIRSWERNWYYDEDENEFDVLYHKTENGNEVYLTLWTPDGQLASMPLDDGYSSDLKEESYYLKLMVDGVEKASQPVTFILPETGELLDSCTLAAGEEKQVSIPVQKDTILKMKLEIESDTNNGEDEVSVVLYKENDGTLIYEDETELYDSREKLLYLDAGESYRLVLTNYNSGSVTVNLFLAEKLEFESVTEFTFGSSTELDAVDILQAVLDKMKVNYTDGTFENYLSWKKSSFEGEFSCWRVTTANGNELELRLRKADGTYASVPTMDLDDGGGVIKAGSYTTELYVDGIEQTDCQQSFTVTAADVNAFEELKPDTDIWVMLKQGESKWFRFTPQTAGEYTLYSEGSDTCAGLYNSDMEFLLEDDDGADGTNFSLTCQLEAGRTYYYKVYGHSKSAAEFTVTLTSRKTLTGVKKGDKPSQTSFSQGDNIYLDLTMILVYDDESEKSFGLSDTDKFGNSVRARMYPIDASGKADMTREYSLSSDMEPGKYLVVVKVCRYDEEENSIPYEGDNFAVMEIEITITEPDHEHVYEWVTESNPTCTEAGLEVYRCTICNHVDDEEEIPATGHTWSGWKKVAEATTSEAEKQERTCSVCGATETKSVGNPLPAETEKPSTPQESEQPSTPSETAKPSTPSESEKPSTPSETAKPSTPQESEQPSTPSETAKPSTPSESEKPSTPSETAKPSTPPESEQPSIPSETAKPSTPSESEQPSTPSETAKPSTPPESEKPVVPTESEKPAAPSETEKQESPGVAPKLKVPANSVKMQKGQATTAFNVTMSKGDSIVSVVSSNKKILKVSKINKTKGTFKLSAKKKTGKVKLTITLASGMKKTVTVKIQKKKVATTKIALERKKLTIKKGGKYTLKPKITPVTSQDKVKYKSSNKKVATVSAKGVIKGKKKGQATITVTSGKKKVKCRVTVK